MAKAPVIFMNQYVRGAANAPKHPWRGGLLAEFRNISHYLVLVIAQFDAGQLKVVG
jgi:hypothetical protein